MAAEKILVVDDDKNICELLRLYLEKEGYSVILSHDGEEALVKFNALKPDLSYWILCSQVWMAGRYVGKSVKNPMFQ